MTVSKGKKHLHVILDDEEEKKFEAIRGFIAKKFGKSGATDANVERAMLYHFYDHVERGELE